MATNHAAGCSYTATAAHASYPDTGGVQLTDGTYSNSVYTDGSWVGWQSTNPEIVIDLGSSKSFEFVSMFQLHDTAHSIYSAEKVKVYGSDDNVNFTFIGAGYPRGINGWWNIPAAGTYRYVKLIITRYGYTDNTANTNYTLISEIRVMSAYETVTYPNDSYVVLDAPLQGAAGATTFADRYGGKTLTGSGGAVIEAKSQFGRNSAKFDGVDDYIASNDSADYAFGTGDFCIEAVGCHNGGAVEASGRMFETAPAGTAGGLIVIRNLTTNTLSVLRSSDSAVLLTSYSAWYVEEFKHIAICRVSGVLYMFINGVFQGSVACTENFTAEKFYVGGNSDGSNANNLGMWMHSIRVSKGAGRYTSDFIPPKRPFGTPAYTAFSKKSKIKFTATPENDYPIKFVVTSASFFADTISAVGEDIRFADLEGNPLSYWIESWTDGTTATIWIRIPTAGTTQIWAYWGNSDAISESAPLAVNDWYDDMNGNGTKGRYIDITASSPTSGPSNFEYSFGRGYYVQKNNVYASSWGGQLRTRGLNEITCGIEVLASTKNVDDDQCGLVFCGQENAEDQFYYVGFFPQSTGVDENKMSKDSMVAGNINQASGARSASTVYAHRVLRYSDQIKWYVGGALYMEGTDASYSQGEVGFGASGNDEGQYILPLIARKYDGTDRLASFVNVSNWATII